MKKFKELVSKAFIVETENVDTDQIVPARFLKNTSREGFGKHLFHHWRFDHDGKPKKNIFNSPQAGQRKILVAGDNFGCGSSREHAVWALTDFGIRAVLSSEFGDIFYNNALKNGLLPIKISRSDLKKITRSGTQNPEMKIRIDLKKQILEIASEEIKIFFEIDDFRKSCLLMGVDELGYILSHKDKIREYEKRF